MEIAVWPLLYVKKECHEINLSGQESCKKSQITKNERLFLEINKISKPIT